MQRNILETRAESPSDRARCFVHPLIGGRHRLCSISLWVLCMLALSSLACSILQTAPGQTQPTPSISPLIGKWKNVSSGEITEYTDKQIILNISAGKLYVDYTLVNDHTYRTNVKDAKDVEFRVTGDILTIVGSDGKTTTYSRVK